MNDIINNPSHYTEGRKHEPIDVINDWGLDFNLGNVVKYISRAGRKDDKLIDLQKAAFYLKYEMQSLQGGKKEEHTQQQEEKRKPVSVVYDKDMNPIGVNIRTLDEDFTIALDTIDDGKEYTWNEAMDRLRELGLKGISKKQMLIISAYSEEVNAALCQTGRNTLCYEWAVGEYNSTYGWLYYPTHGALYNIRKYYAFQVRPLLASEKID